MYTVSKIPADMYLPGGARSEVFHGVVKCSTNLNSDPVDMLLDCLNDVVLGGPKVRTDCNRIGEI